MELYIFSIYMYIHMWKLYIFSMYMHMHMYILIIPANHILHPPPHTQEEDDEITRLAKEDQERLAKEASFESPHI